jgi:chaperone BCS1
MTGYLSPNMRNWYNERGLPYRRGYLLYGPPGTGKSSFSFSIAGHLDLDVYIVSLVGVNDDTLAELFAKLPQHCLVLLEDIDVATRNRAQEKDAEDAESMSSLSYKGGKSVTLSGLLNVLDGVGSQEGRVLIMTTNYIERLDTALIRPGCVDLKVEFRLADKSMAMELYRLVFQEPGEKDNEAVEQLADEFARRMPEGEFSPAEVLSILLEHRQNPEAVVANVEAWVARTREEKMRVRGGALW